MFEADDQTLIEISARGMTATAFRVPWGTLVELDPLGGDLLDGYFVEKQPSRAEGRICIRRKMGDMWWEPNPDDTMALEDRLQWVQDVWDGHVDLCRVSVVVNGPHPHLYGAAETKAVLSKGDTIELAKIANSIVPKAKADLERKVKSQQPLVVALRELTGALATQPQAAERLEQNLVRSLDYDSEETDEWGEQEIWTDEFAMFELDRILRELLQPLADTADILEWRGLIS